MISFYRTDQVNRFAPLSYLKHSFISSLNVKVCIRFVVFLQISLCFCFFFSYVGWEVCAFASHVNAFCFQSKGGGVGEEGGGRVKYLRTGGWGLKDFRTVVVLLLGGGQYPITCHEKTDEWVFSPFLTCLNILRPWNRPLKSKILKKGMRTASKK